ncbi:hypothetical protein [Planotetraspora kaengkrachanensis]|uniref:Peptidase C1A papain C-terminal domain-containing protein n=1 Tax=Planotetraspora kaengkrachanensis TaxID=575193 RepID=A0A8J3LVC9_9ACTN|nr:hypothetical protein [Planotetraspora kaengkrachanensis]GIG79437.1 hypothetical protein Pka01_25640 [Planotetraspora kaengkrachanensis]
MNITNGDRTGAPPLGRRAPADWRHVERYPYSAVAPETVATVERALPLPAFRRHYDQRREGACVGFSSSWMMSVLNRPLYDARWLWSRAKEVDEWPSTNPGDDQGTSVRAAMDVLRDEGHCRLFRGLRQAVSLTDGIAANRWATTVDEVRTCIANGTPVVLGCNWYSNFDRPGDGGWIGKGDLGAVRGGHAICVYRASDSRQAVRLVNSWGTAYPLVWLPYEVLQRLIDEDGEVTLVTDR